MLNPYYSLCSWRSLASIVAACPYCNYWRLSRWPRGPCGLSRGCRGWPLSIPADGRRRRVSCGSWRRGTCWCRGIACGVDLGHFTAYWRYLDFHTSLSSPLDRLHHPTRNSACLTPPQESWYSSSSCGNSTTTSLDQPASSSPSPWTWHPSCRESSKMHPIWVRSGSALLLSPFHCICRWCCWFPIQSQWHACSSDTFSGEQCHRFLLVDCRIRRLGTGCLHALSPIQLAHFTFHFPFSGFGWICFGQFWRHCFFFV